MSSKSADWENIIAACRVEVEELALLPKVQPRNGSGSAGGKRGRGRQAFLRIPWAQFTALRTRRVSLVSVFVYAALWRQHMLRRSRTIALTSAVLASLELTRWDKSRALACLEAHGFIRVERQPGQNPRVTVLEVPADAC